ncbi:MAG TPA: aldo/keto reductase [Stackebrandtia sp.]|uniref:aldo/keto reductase n=1 Tax=Stackebrandtia sp. TaxID=2023065 RepID=UPI002D57CBBE|nr:aldo/keto reductase [Stackebrandtia sp.]HZE37345.1 aldo/keto reductase [Stackebrandtia sp.]
MTQQTDTFLLGGDLPIGRLGFGAMRLTSGWEANTPAVLANARAVARRAVSLGVTFIDTADAYGLGANEEALADALHPYPDDLVIGTKVGHCRPGQGRWVPLGRPEYLRQQVALSLRRLRVERIDLLQLHRVDPQVPFADQIGTLTDLVAEGKVRHIGLSEVDVATLAEARRLAPIASVQNLFNLDNRKHEDVLDYCTRHHIAFIPWLPLSNGAQADAEGPVAAIAKELDATASQVALAWQLHRSRAVVPIPGTKSLAHLEENVAAARLRLTASHVAQLNQG